MPLRVRLEHGYLNTVVDTEESGHGTHVTSVIAQQREHTRWAVSRHRSQRQPWCRSRRLTPTGGGSYLDVIRGIDWVVTNKDVYGIRVLESIL